MNMIKKEDAKLLLVFAILGALAYGWLLEPVLRLIAYLFE